MYRIKMKRALIENPSLVAKPISITYIMNYDLYIFGCQIILLIKAFDGIRQGRCFLYK